MARGQSASVVLGLGNTHRRLGESIVGTSTLMRQGHTTMTANLNGVLIEGVWCPETGKTAP